MPPKPKGKTTWPIVVAARDLRQNETEAEDILWTVLRGKRLNGLKFRRQHPYENYILDFFCVEHQLVVELDGSIHDQPDQSEYDAERTKFLNERGLKVVRFRNEDIIKSLPNVLQKIIEIAARP